jgi:ArsR family transcriptional regulator
MKIKQFSLAVGEQIYKAMGDKSRLRILNLLYHYGEVCISDIELALEYTQAKTSRHIYYLKNSGLLTAERKEQWVFYAIKAEWKDVVKQILKFMEKDNTLLQDAEHYRILETNRELAAYQIKLKQWQRDAQ